ncbi:MAG: hypothetical protein WAW39_30060 [Prosthecobacter sp.]|uniref:hypothetical protein n=1 Tax=Prosthecobacter sp. TaxID=1965333 RepID=UPI003BB07B24
MKSTTLKNALITLLLAGTAVIITACASGGASSTLGGAKAYPRNTCIVTDNDLGSMGDEQRLVYQGQELKFCCAPCVKKFQANPTRYLAKLQ